MFIKNIEYFDNKVKCSKIIGMMIATRGFPVESFDGKNYYFYKTEELENFLKNPLNLLVKRNGGDDG